MSEMPAGYDAWRTDSSELSETVEQEKARDQAERLRDVAPEMFEALKEAERELYMYVDLQMKLDYIEYAQPTIRVLEIVRSVISRAST